MAYSTNAHASWLEQGASLAHRVVGSCPKRPLAALSGFDAARRRRTRHCAPKAQQRKIPRTPKLNLCCLLCWFLFVGGAWHLEWQIAPRFVLVVLFSVGPIAWDVGLATTKPTQHALPVPKSWLELAFWGMPFPHPTERSQERVRHHWRRQGSWAASVLLRASQPKVAKRSV